MAAECFRGYFSFTEMAEEFRLYIDETLGVYTADVPAYMKLFIKVSLRKRMKDWFYSVGVGRHTRHEIGEMMKKDIRHLSAILGDQHYLMGGDSPTEIDCAAFGQLAQIRWATPDSCPGKQLLMGELPNLMEYTDRIKTKFWPDWDELLWKKGS